MTMSVREKLQDPKTGLTAAAILAIAAVTIATVSLWPNTRRSNPKLAFYSDDDGQSFFEDSIYKLAPFDHDGKTAVIATVFSVNGHKYVVYLRRFTPEAKKKLQAVLDANPDQPYKMTNLLMRPEFGQEGMEVKLPGKDNPWLPGWKLSTLHVEIPDNGVPTPVFP